ncbi:MAG: hypothetical protein NT062_34040 [Proteobacteria bacterium]|nr:hypothetical protein [Pseudomonadota bacterium]
MSRAHAIAKVLASALDATDKLEPAERDFIRTMLVADLRSRWPESVSPLTLGPPTEAIRDPRAREEG